MTYNTDRRKPLRKSERSAFLEAHGCRCYYCGEPITDDDWDDEHIRAKELMPPGSDWNAMSNRAPIHRRPCHKTKTAADRKLISKSNRIRRANGPPELRKRPKRKLQSRGFDKGHRPIPSRKFQQLS